MGCVTPKQLARGGGANAHSERRRYGAQVGSARLGKQPAGCNVLPPRRRDEQTGEGSLRARKDEQGSGIAEGGNDRLHGSQGAGWEVYLFCWPTGKQAWPA